MVILIVNIDYFDIIFDVNLDANPNLAELCTK